ncbi:MAG: GNAT family N-acetyltransferase [Candidatus Natronoplasma sp.]
MSIRECEEKDIDEVIQIEEESFDHPYPDEVFYHHLGSDLFLVYEDPDKGSITGYVMGEERDDHGVIISIAISPSSRFEGIGTTLMEVVQSRMDTDHFFVTVRPSNQGAIRFYKKKGFIKVGMIEDYYENGEDAVAMVRKEQRKD